MGGGQKTAPWLGQPPQVAGASPRLQPLSEGSSHQLPLLPQKCPDLNNKDTVTLSVDHLWPRAASSHKQD